MAQARTSLLLLLLSTQTLVDDTRNDWASTCTQTAAYNMEVVVSVHAAQTTTSKAETRFGVITKPKRKSITSETLTPASQHPRSYCSTPFNIIDNFKTTTALFNDYKQSCASMFNLQLFKLTQPLHQQQHSLTSRLPCCISTLTNIETHAKHTKKRQSETKTQPKTPTRTPSTHPQKNFSAPILIDPKK